MWRTPLRFVDPQHPITPRFTSFSAVLTSAYPAFRPLGCSDLLRFVRMTTGTETTPETHISERRLAANRANAQRSTGPRTELDGCIMPLCWMKYHKKSMSSLSSGSGALP